jgi:hypothetical protein
MFLRNVHKFLSDYMTSYSRRQQFSNPNQFINSLLLGMGVLRSWWEEFYDT